MPTGKSKTPFWTISTVKCATQSLPNRNLTQDQIKERIDKGPFTAKRAVECGVVDRLAYSDELEVITEESTGEMYSLVKAKAYLNTEMFEPDWEVPLPKIAIIEATGTMVTGESFSDPFTGTRTMGSATIARAVRSVRENDSIKAAVLRIDSGGGWLSPQTLSGGS